MLANEHILQGRHVREQADVLKGPGDAQRGNAEWLQTHQVCSREHQFARGDRINTGNGIEEGCLAGAIWADQPGNHPLFHYKINRVDGGKAAKGLGHFACFEKAHPTLLRLNLADFRNGGRALGDRRHGRRIFGVQFRSALGAGDQSFWPDRHHDDQGQAEEQESV